MSGFGDHSLPRRRSTVLVVALLGGMLVTGSPPPSPAAMAKPKPIVTVVRHGGLCIPGRECRSVLRITDTTISAPGHLPRRLKPSERAALLRAVRMLDLAHLRAHPFKGICPTASDGSELIYRFRGFSQALATCRFELRGVKAVSLTDQLLATLKPRR
jgi:hypothetical protein